MSPLQIAALIIAYLLAFARLFDAARWAWAWIPAKFQPLAPALLAAIPAIVDAFRGVTTQMELTVAIMGALGTLTTAMRGALPNAQFVKLDEHSKDALRAARGGESKKTPPSEPPSTRPSGRPPMVPPALTLLLCSFLFAPALPGCSGEQPAMRAPTRDELELACPEAAKVSTVDCPALAVSSCRGFESLDECPAGESVRQECSRLREEALSQCR